MDRGCRNSDNSKTKQDEARLNDLLREGCLASCVFFPEPARRKKNCKRDNEMVEWIFEQEKAEI